MKNVLVYVTLVVLFFIQSTTSATADRLKLLKIVEPENEAGRRLLVDLEDLKVIVEEFNLPENIAADIEFTNRFGDVFATLGRIKKNTITWKHKTEDDKYLRVKFRKRIYNDVLEKIKKKGNGKAESNKKNNRKNNKKSNKKNNKKSNERNDERKGVKESATGYQVRISEYVKRFTSDQPAKGKAKYYENFSTKYVCNITFDQYTDLSASMQYPVSITPAEDLKDKIAITLTNSGTISSGVFVVQLVLSHDRNIPMESASPSTGFKEDALLVGGRMSVQSLKPGEERKLRFKTSVIVPGDTPPGRYYLGTIIDPLNKCGDIHRQNNMLIKEILVVRDLNRH